MTDDVKPRRAYRSTKRAEQVARTRRDIVMAAGVQFRTHGFAGVSMPGLAAEAGVAVETIYRAFGSKAGLFRAVVDAAVAGGAARAQVPVVDRPAIQAAVARSPSLPENLSPNPAWRTRSASMRATVAASPVCADRRAGQPSPTARPAAPATQCSIARLLIMRRIVTGWGQIVNPQFLHVWPRRIRAREDPPRHGKVTTCPWC